MLTDAQIKAIPAELRLLDQWVGASNKVPVQAATGAPASVTDPSTWGSFHDALQGLEDKVYSHIGFVFSDADPYVFIDLDAPKDDNHKILPETDPAYLEAKAKSMSWIKAFSSYSEKSASGHGYHIIIKASLKAAMRMKGTEIYFSQRYAIFTGDVVADLPIAQRQDELDQIVQALRLGAYKPKKVTYSSTPYKEEVDQPVLNRIGAASNSAAIKALWEGNYKDTHPSQSEADMALLSHLCFYTSDDAQVARLFRMSALGQRRKANNPNDPYVEQSIARIRAATPPPIDFTNFKPTIPVVPLIVPKIVPFPRPPGLLGEIADYIQGAAIHPVKEVAYAGALAFAAGIAGRHFNISGTGLNIYVLLLAATGMGKEGASDGIDNLYAAIRPQIPEVETFRGPSNFASGGGLVRSMSEKTVPSALAVIGEFGLRLSTMSHPRANAAEIMLRSALLDFFSKSGEGKVIAPTAYSDSSKNTTLLQAPALSILGVSTPETFFEKLTDASVSDGLIPRFLTVAVTGEPQVSSKTRQLTPSQALVDKIAEVVQLALYMGRNNSYCHIPVSPEASKRFDDYELFVVEKMRNYPDGAIRNILNRAHLKALRLSGLAAVFDNPRDPKVTLPHAEWAIKFVESDCLYMLSRFEGGHVGEGDHRELALVREKMASFVAGKAKVVNMKWQAMLDAGVIPYTLLSQRLLNSATFANDRRGATAALNQTLKTLEDMGEVQLLQPGQVFEKFGVNGRAYALIGG